MKGIDRMLERKWGVFTHYIYKAQNNPKEPMNQGAGEMEWDACVNELDIGNIARTLADVGAGYYFITLMQGRKYMAAPNSTFDEIAQTKPGEACSRRDVPLELIRALKPFDIDLYLYFAGDGPYLDEPVGRKFGYWDQREKVSREFVEKWASVLREYAVRYGEQVHGWWIDGAYPDSLGYTDELLELLWSACKAGNKESIVALNYGIGRELRKNFSKEEFVCGEFNDFTVIPKERFIDGAQAHILAPLGTPDEYNPGSWCGPGWGRPGCKRSKEYMLDYVKRVNDAGGTVTIDVCLYRDGTFDPAQLEVLNYIGSHIR